MPLVRNQFSFSPLDSYFQASRSAIDQRFEAGLFHRFDIRFGGDFLNADVPVGDFVPVAEEGDVAGAALDAFVLGVGGGKFLQIFVQYLPCR